MNEQADILAATRQVAANLKGSALYRDYRRAKIRITENPSLAFQLYEYKKKQAEFEYKRLQNGTVNFEEEKYISHLYTNLTLNEDAGRYLSCERELLTLYRQIMDAINDACEIDVY